MDYLFPAVMSQREDEDEFAVDAAEVGCYFWAEGFLGCGRGWQREESCSGWAECRGNIVHSDAVEHFLDVWAEVEGD